ncbi:hypothetical protein K461DRAFT_125023 [Myriangium duriaei CBS 260.36]|uniref:Ribosomal protein/NADH dehydrogenase domain-containing protein n=1 Tax=Myriangium duriaei CBS 260.36 TaxID=1168546 RepID=A0A9P4J877_9PEZI|nr:hypothetical protein K461DRAFT_125023 [Myriangium duriaei CBS 260.36]
MSSFGVRLRKMQTKLLAMRMGSGAVKLPKEVQRIHLGFAKKSGNGHMGPRKFWHHELVRLKFHNPAVSMTVDRDLKNDQEALLTVFFAPEDAHLTSNTATGGPSATTSTSGAKVASDHAPVEKTESVKISHKRAEEILADLIRITDAEPIEPAEEDVQLERELADQEQRSKADHDRGMALNAEKARQAALLAEARGQT